PSYTGLPPTSLSVRQGVSVAVPVGSTISLRVHGAPRTPGLMTGLNNPPRFSGADGEYASTFTVAHDATLRVQVGGEAIGKWDLHVIPDSPPTIAFNDKPKATAHLATDSALSARDDYGITKIQVILKPHAGTGKARTVNLALAP